MNHPFPSILPLLRQIYAGRFSHVRFLVPFERMPDNDDVITVYRGSYTHSAYLTDAYPQLAALDFDYLIAIHDDVLLNPRITEATFSDTFDQLGPDDGFIADMHAPITGIGDWIWHAAFVPSLLFPKSLLFGGGVERANLMRYLPPADLLRERMEAQGISHTLQLRTGAEHMQDVATMAARVLLHGAAEPLRSDQTTSDIEAEALALQTRLFDFIAQEAARLDPAAGVPANRIDLPFPVATSGFYTDFYVLPRSGFADFAHYAGVAAAAGLFVEIITPILLAASCAKIWRAGQMGLDFSGFVSQRHVQRFADPKVVAMHPVKLSRFREPNAQAEFLASLHKIVDAPAEPGTYSVNKPLGVDFRAGWHEPEAWGAWSCAERAEALIEVPASGTAVLVLRLVPHAGMPHIGGQVERDGRPPLPFSVTLAQPEVEVTLYDVVADAGATAAVTIRCDALTRPCDFSLDNTDTRPLGVALMRVYQG